MRTIRIVLTLCAAAFLIPACGGGGGGGGGSAGGGAPVVPPSTERVSLTAASLQSTGGSFGPSVSADGRTVAFASSATNLVPGDTNGSLDVFVRDLESGTTTRVSVASNGAQGDNDSDDPVISADGRYVAFHSSATNLIPVDTNGSTDIYVRDTLEGTTVRVSLTSTSAQSNGHSVFASMSADGRYVAFRSAATNLVPGDTNGALDVFVRDTLASTTVRASVTAAGAQSTGGGSFQPVISADGRYVAFESLATNLVPGDTNLATDVFVRDLLLGTTVRASVDSQGSQSNDDCFEPAISGDGRYVTFHSEASSLVPGDTNVASDVFVRDLVAGTTVRVSVDALGGQSPGESVSASISSDGRYVAFTSFGSITAGDTNLDYDVFVRDTMQGTTFVLSINTAGALGNDASDQAALSPDGRYVAFISSATNLVPGDTNGTLDVFIRGPLW